MNVPIEHQIVSYDGRPAFVLVPWEEYRERFVSSVEAEDNPSLPWEVGKKIALEGKSPIRAWREHLQMSQIEVAEKIGVSRAGYAQMESSSANPRVSTLIRIAKAFNIRVAQLIMD